MIRCQIFAKRERHRGIAVAEGELCGGGCPHQRVAAAGLQRCIQIAVQQGAVRGIDGQRLRPAAQRGKERLGIQIKQQLTQISIGAGNKRIPQAQRAGRRAGQRGVRGAGGSQYLRGKVICCGKLCQQAHVSAGGIGGTVVTAQQSNACDVACVSRKILQLGDDLEVPRPILRVRKQCRVQNGIIPHQPCCRVTEPAEIFIGQLRRQGEKGFAALAHTVVQPLVGVTVKPDLKQQHNGQQQGQYGKKGAAQNAS